MMSGVDAVYGSHTWDTEAVSPNKTTSYSITIELEALPTSLTRVFSLLTTVSMLPTNAQSTRIDNETIRLTLNIDEIEQHRFELLYRQICRLPEAVAVSSVELD